MALPSLLIFFHIFMLSTARALIPVASNHSIIGISNSLRDGETIVSPGQKFELGFFSPGNSIHRYLGIWYKDLPRQTVVWVANRNLPITDKSGCLNVSTNGTLLLQNDTNLIWAVFPHTSAISPILQLLDSGNLVMRDNNESKGYLWQSFDHPCNILLPGMKLSWNLVTQFSRNLTSWKSVDDPSSGDYTFTLESPDQASQLVVYKGSDKEYRWSPWNGITFSGSGETKANPFFKQVFVSKENEVYYTLRIPDTSVLSMLLVNREGMIQYQTWRNHSDKWITVATLQKDSCDRYGICGAYASCYYGVGAMRCQCLDGFKPKSAQDWRLMDWSGGCDREVALDCANGDGFVRYEGIKLPDGSLKVLGKRVLTREECEQECKINCDCMAFSFLSVNTTSNCIMWFGELIDMKHLPTGGDQIYIRMARAALHATAEAKKKEQESDVLFIVLTILTAAFLFYLLVRFICCIISDRLTAVTQRVSSEVHQGNQDEALELPVLDLLSISNATKKFSDECKIGWGGFGLVYKGTLPNGLEIAVKRLTEKSAEANREFRNEVLLLKNLNHRNVVRLMGCCIQGEERMLIYEYLPNGSLDRFVFDENRRKVLTWAERFKIIIGIARGLLYLHQDSRLRIIHRDLKASNILLDSAMIPKISDFGAARTFEGDQTENMTMRVVGTIGYMPPEYALDGRFSMKSDTFSFGVLMLEIISGKKNRGFFHLDHSINLIGHAWKLWEEGSPLKLVDNLMEGSVSVDEVLKCIQVGLLCVQHYPEDRPVMASVIAMLSDECNAIPYPKTPCFCIESSSTGGSVCTTNYITVTELVGR